MSIPRTPSISGATRLPAMTVAPWSRSVSATQRPIPRAAPVTSATRPSSPSNLIDSPPRSFGTNPDPEPVERHRADQERAPGNVLPERVYSGEREPVVEDPDDEKPDGRPDDRPPAAAQARTAEHDRRDHRKLHADSEEP